MSPTKEMKTAFFDLETQYLFKEVGGRENIHKLKIALVGIRIDSQNFIFAEDKLLDAIKILQEADLIIGHNILGFDYLVIEPYIEKEIIEMLKKKTFDMMYELSKIIVGASFIGLDDLAKRNLGIKKTCDSILIPGMWREGKHKEVEEYLKNDLKVTEAVYNYAKSNRKLKYEHKNYNVSGGEKEVKINWK